MALKEKQKEEVLARLSNIRQNLLQRPMTHQVLGSQTLIDAAEQQIINKVIEEVNQVCGILKVSAQAVRVDLQKSIVFFLAESIIEMRDITIVKRLEALLNTFKELTDRFTLETDPTRTGLVTIIESPLWFQQLNEEKTTKESEIIRKCISLLTGDRGGNFASLSRALSGAVVDLAHQAAVSALEAAGAKYYPVARLDPVTAGIFSTNIYRTFRERRRYADQLQTTPDILSQVLQQSNEAACEALRDTAMQRRMVKEFLRSFTPAQQGAAAQAALLRSPSTESLASAASLVSSVSGRVTLSDLPEKFRKLTVAGVDGLNAADLRQVCESIANAIERTQLNLSLLYHEESSSEEEAEEFDEQGRVVRNVDNIENRARRNDRAILRPAAHHRPFALEAPPVPEAALLLKASELDEKAKVFCADVIYVQDGSESSNIADLVKNLTDDHGQSRDGFTWAISPMVQKPPYTLVAMMRHIALEAGDIPAARTIVNGCRGLRALLSPHVYTRFVSTPDRHAVRSPLTLMMMMLLRLMSSLLLLAFLHHRPVSSLPATMAIR